MSVLRVSNLLKISGVRSDVVFCGKRQSSGGDDGDSHYDLVMETRATESRQVHSTVSMK